MAIFRRPSKKIFFPSVAAADGDPQKRPSPVQVAAAEDAVAADASGEGGGPVQQRMPSAYGAMLDGKEKEGTVDMTVDTFDGPFMTDPHDDSIRSEKEVFTPQWQRLPDGSVVISQSVENNILGPQPNGMAQFKGARVEETVNRTDEGVHVTTDYYEVDNANAHPKMKGDAHATVAAEEKKPEPVSDMQMKVHMDRQYDENGLLKERIVTRTSDGGEDAPGNYATAHEKYSDGYLATSEFHSRTRSEDNGVPAGTTVDKNARYDKGGLVSSYKTTSETGRYTSPDTAASTFNATSTQDVGRNPDGTYTIKETRQKTVNGKVVSRQELTVIASDSEGKKVVSGMRTTVDANGKKTEEDYDANRKGWPSDLPQAAPQNASEQPVTGVITTAAKQKPRATSSHPAM